MRPLATAGAAALCLAALGVGCALEKAPAEFPRVLVIEAVPVEITPAELHRLRLRGAVALRSNHPAVGGISGLLVEGGTMLALTDHGWLLRSRLADDPAGLRPVGGDIAPLRDAEGRRLKDPEKDSEALARSGERLAVAFERDHRIEIRDSGRPERTLRDGRFGRLGYNEGLEALATLPDGRLIAIAEEPRDGAFPVFLLDDAGVAAEGALPQVGRHFVTGADLGPDGRLYLVRRDFSLLTGISIRVERYRLGPDGFPRPGTREQLAAFETSSGIDNMEAIAVWLDDAGRTRLTIVSDDNFRPLLQRTLLVDFEVLD